MVHYSSMHAHCIPQTTTHACMDVRTHAHIHKHTHTHHTTPHHTHTHTLTHTHTHHTTPHTYTDTHTHTQSEGGSCCLVICGYEKIVLSTFLTVDEDGTSCDNEFHCLGPVKEKDRSLKVFVFVRGTRKVLVSDAERSCLDGW